MNIFVISNEMGRTMGYGGGWRRGRGFGGGYGGGWIPINMPAMTPLQPNTMRIAATVDANNGLNSPISFRAGRAPYIAIIDVSGNKITSINIYPNMAMNIPRGAGIQLAQWLLNGRISIFIASNVGPNVEMVLRQAGVKIHIVSPGTMLGAVLASMGISA